ncbi:MAG: endolytic transglycosylase MltG [Elusimicrobiaceae bacterium]|nr:endolytic transglycosylase MltG [Elusimicrobiaceae bacterium]
MKKAIITLLLTAAISGGLWARYFLPGPVVEIDIAEGASGAAIARQLKSKGVISSTTLFRGLLKVSAMSSRLKPGRYRINSSIGAEIALWRLAHDEGRVYLKVTFPEGWRIEEYGARLEESGVCKSGEFVRLARERGLEGYLFPSTYLLEPNTPPQRIIEAMLGEYNKTIKPLLAKDVPDYLRTKDVLTVASIVQREALYDDERPLVASVYLNRIRQRKALEADPTVQYAVGYCAREGRWWKKALSYDDLKIDSPYNTYKYQNLPPGPICSPGYESVYAVLHPAPGDAIFFVADTTGRHTFNSAYSDHLKAKALMKKRLREGKNN